MGTQDAAGMGSDIDAAQRRVDSVTPSPLMVVKHGCPSQVEQLQRVKQTYNNL